MWLRHVRALVSDAVKLGVSNSMGARPIGRVAVALLHVGVYRECDKLLVSLSALLWSSSLVNRLVPRPEGGWLCVLHVCSHSG